MRFINAMGMRQLPFSVRELNDSVFVWILRFNFFADGIVQLVQCWNIALVLHWSAIFSNARSNCFLRRWRARGRRGWSYRRVSIRSVWPAALSSLDDKSMGGDSCKRTGRADSRSASPPLSTPVRYPVASLSTSATGVRAPQVSASIFHAFLKVFSKQLIHL